MNKNLLYIDSIYSSLEEADKNAKEFSENNRSQYYHVIPLEENKIKVSRYYEKKSIKCFYRGIEMGV